MRPHAALLHPAQDARYPVSSALRRERYLHVSHSAATWVVRPTVTVLQCWAPITLVLLNNGPKAREQRCWQFRHGKDELESVSFK